jgi:protein pelota
MRLLKYDRKSNAVTLQVTSPNDLWFLETVLIPGDAVSARTTRMLRSPDGSERRDRVSTNLTIRLERTGFEPFSSTLRITGKVIEDPDELGILGSYHTLVVEQGSVLTISKREWRKEVLVELGRERIGQEVMLISIDYEEVALARVWDYGVQTIASWKTGIPGKQDPKYEEKFESQVTKIASEIQKYAGDTGFIIFSGPGYLKQKLFDELRKNLSGRGVSLQPTFVDTSYGGSSGIKEAVDKMLEKGFLEKLRLAEETKIVDRLFKELSTNPDKVAIGLETVKEALSQGMVQELIISNNFLKNHYDLASSLMAEAENYGAETKIISEHHEKGGQLLGLGGVVATLRYPIKRYNSSYKGSL